MPEPVFNILANRAQGGRAVGGRLSVIADELRFEPNFFDARTGGHPWSTPLSAIRALGDEPGSWTLGNLFNGGFRTRLAVELATGERELFVVNGLPRVIAELTALLPTLIDD